MWSVPHHHHNQNDDYHRFRWKFSHSLLGDAPTRWTSSLLRWTYSRTICKVYTFFFHASHRKQKGHSAKCPLPWMPKEPSQLDYWISWFENWIVWMKYLYRLFVELQRVTFSQRNIAAETNICPHTILCSSCIYGHLTMRWWWWWRDDFLTGWAPIRCGAEWFLPSKGSDTGCFW